MNVVIWIWCLNRLVRRLGIVVVLFFFVLVLRKVLLMWLWSGFEMSFGIGEFCLKELMVWCSLMLFLLFIVIFFVKVMVRLFFVCCLWWWWNCLGCWKVRLMFFVKLMFVLWWYLKRVFNEFRMKDWWGLILSWWMLFFSFLFWFVELFCFGFLILRMLIFIKSLIRFVFWWVFDLFDLRWCLFFWWVGGGLVRFVCMKWIFVYVLVVVFFLVIFLGV